MKEIGATLIFFAVTLVLFSQMASHKPGEPLIQQVCEELSGILHGRLF